MSKISQRKVSYYTAGRNAGFKFQKRQHLPETEIARKRFIKFVPKLFRLDFLHGWAAGLNGEISNQAKKKIAKYLKSKRNLK